MDNDTMLKKIQKYLFKSTSMFVLYINIDNNDSLKKIYDFYFNNIRPTTGTLLELLFYGMYYYVNKDYVNAVLYYSKGVDMGCPNAMFNLGLYYKYQGKDSKKMFKYYEMAINLGQSYAMNSLGKYYVTKNKNDRLRDVYLKMAAECNNPCGLQNFAEYCCTGDKKLEIQGMASREGNVRMSKAMAKHYENKDDDMMLKYYVEGIDNGNWYPDNHMYYSSYQNCQKMLNDYISKQNNVALYFKYTKYLTNENLYKIIELLLDRITEKNYYISHNTSIDQVLKEAYLSYAKKLNCADSGLDGNGDINYLIKNRNNLSRRNLKRLIDHILKYYMIDDQIKKMPQQPLNDLYQEYNEKINQENKQKINEYLKKHECNYDQNELKGDTLTRVYDFYFNDIKQSNGNMLELEYYGIYCQIKKDYDKMKVYYKMAIAKGSTIAIINIARHHYAQKEYNDAMKYYVIGIEKDIDRCRVQLNKLLDEIGDPVHLINYRKYLSYINKDKLRVILGALGKYLISNKLTLDDIMNDIK